MNFLFIIIASIFICCKPNENCKNLKEFKEYGFKICLIESAKVESKNKGYVIFETKKKDSILDGTFYVKVDKCPKDWNSKIYRDLQENEYKKQIEKFKILSKGTEVINGNEFYFIESLQNYKEKQIYNVSFFLVKNNIASSLDAMYIFEKERKINDIRRFWKNFEITNEPNEAFIGPN